MKISNKSIYFVLFTSILCIVFLQLFIKRNPLYNKVYLFEVKKDTLAPGNLIYFDKNVIYITEIISMGELTSSDDNKESVLLEGLERSITLANEYQNYKFNRVKKTITADGLDDLIKVISPIEISYKGNVYTLDKEIKFKRNSR